MKTIVLRLFLTFLACGYFLHGYAQQNRIDSIAQMLEQSKTKKGIDSSMFAKAADLIRKSTLNDASIVMLEKVVNRIAGNNNKYWMYAVKLNMVYSLSANDPLKSIALGKNYVEVFEKSKVPHASFFRSGFLRALRYPYRNSDMLNEGFKYFNEKLKDYKLHEDAAGLADCYYVLSSFYRVTGLMDQAIYNLKKSTSYMTDSANENAGILFSNPLGIDLKVNNMRVIIGLYMDKGDYDEVIKSAADFYNEAKKHDSAAEPPIGLIAQAKILSGDLDSVPYYLNLLFENQNVEDIPEVKAGSLQIRALYEIKTGALEKAEADIHECWLLIEQNNIPAASWAGTIAPDFYLALVRMQQDRIEDAVELLKKDIIRLGNQRLNILRDYKLMGELYEKSGNNEKAKDAYKVFISLQDSVSADKNKYASLSFETEQEMKDKELAITKLQSENKISTLTKNFSFGIAFMILLLAGVIFYRFKSKQKANKILEATLANLKSTQSQLIQSEKMASLGELTAGIAHEIQNPLNFVNNFSDINKELLGEMKDEMKKGNFDEADSIANDIIENEQKINHHGKRADAIVKGMLQHSRSSSGVKEPTDINALCDEYLRLAYHGLRAKDKSFNATLETKFDETLSADEAGIGKINVVPQDIGRVLLNIINNAFYACTERSRSTSNERWKNLQGFENLEGLGDGDGLRGSYVPTVTLVTRKENDHVTISVRDNGSGIPEKIKDKIFQPFFTTKPTGSGTGLGLSLAYDIVNAHNGEMRVNSKEGEFTEFIITLPDKKN